MGRRRRPNLPGAIFHLTARTIDRDRWFTPVLRTAALRVVAAAVPRSGVRLLAVAIMSNHLHLVVQQGARPLHALMQPVLRRLAHLLQRSHDLQGPVFWRPYACAPCFDPDHARNAIAYTHLNPVRAKLCTGPADYAWTSHGLYVRGQPGAPGSSDGPVAHLADVVDTACALPLFGRGFDRPLDLLQDDYLQYVEWRLSMDRSADCEHRGRDDAPVIAHPALPAGDSHWNRTFSPLFHSPIGAGHASSLTPGSGVAPALSDLARATLAGEAPELSLDLVRGRRGGARYCEIRHRMIRRMNAAGHRNVDIARFLDLSESAVSRVVCCAPRSPPGTP